MRLINFGGRVCAAVLIAFIFIITAGIVNAAIVTGDPQADGWTLGGHSLANGVYVRNNANYGFNTYSEAITVTAGSMLNIDDGDYSWQVGDTVLGLGGKFADITAEQAGWSEITGNAVNVLRSAEYGPKLIGKFGTANAAFSASTIAPGSGNGTGSTSAGGVGTVYVRTSGWFHDYIPLPDQTTDTTWSNSTGILMLLDKDSHISREGTTTPDKRVARVIWYWDSVTENVLSWEILLNVSLLDRTAPTGFAGLTPAAGNLAIVSVQDRDSAYTDALTTIIPEPTTMVLLALGGLFCARRKGI